MDNHHQNLDSSQSQQLLRFLLQQQQEPQPQHVVSSTPTQHQPDGPSFLLVALTSLADEDVDRGLNTKAVFQISVSQHNKRKFGRYEDDDTTSVGFITRDIVESVCPAELLHRVALRALSQTRGNVASQRKLACQVIKLKYGNGYETTIGIDKVPTDDDETVELSVGLSMSKESRPVGASSAPSVPSNIGCIMNPKDSAWRHLASGMTHGQEDSPKTLWVRTDCPSWLEVDDKMGGASNENDAGDDNDDDGDGDDNTSGRAAQKSIDPRHRTLVVWRKSKEGEPFQTGRIEDITQNLLFVKKKKQKKKISTPASAKKKGTVVSSNSSAKKKQRSESHDDGDDGGKGNKRATTDSPAEEEKEEDEDEVKEGWENEEQADKVSKKKKKKTKDPNKPKGITNAYLLFFKDRRKDIQAANPDLKFNEFGKVVSAEWKKLTDEEHQVWRDKAAKDKKRYEEEMENYKPPEEKEDSKDEGGKGDEGHSKAKKKKKDPNAPKRNMNSYMLFCNTTRGEIKAANPNATFKEMGSLFADRWKNLDKEERKVWDDKAAEDKKRYEEEMLDYSAPGDGDHLDDSDEQNKRKDDDDDDDDDDEPEKKKKKKKITSSDGEKSSSKKKEKDKSEEGSERGGGANGKTGTSKEMGAESSKNSKKKKDPNAPKRNLNSYMIYCAATRPGVKAENPDVPFGEITKMVSAQFKGLSDEEKKVWEGKAAQDKKRYEAELAKYNETQTGKQSPPSHVLLDTATKTVTATSKSKKLTKTKGTAKKGIQEMKEGESTDEDEEDIEKPDSEVEQVTAKKSPKRRKTLRKRSVRNSVGS